MPKRGIDISCAQRAIDLVNLKAAGVEFVIIRAGISTSEDAWFKEHIDEAIRAKLPYGFYWYSSAFSTMEAKSEAAKCIETIKGYSPAMPVFYDMEEKSQIDELTKEERTNIIIMFCEEIKKAGYTAGVYLNPSWLENYVDKSRLVGKYDIWLAHWTENPDIPSNYDYGQSLWQWGLDHINGIGLDGDICFKDYGEQKFPEEHQEDQPLTVGTIVDFTGTKQFLASTADIPHNAAPCKAKITIIAKGTAHPYHIVDEKGAKVYGWVDEGTVSPLNNNGNTEVKAEHKAGEKIELTNAPLFFAAGSKNCVNRLNGTYYLYDGEEVDGYYRICPSEANVNALPIAANVTGWIKKESIE